MKTSKLQTPPALAASGAEANIGGMLLEQGKITPEDAERILRLQKDEGIRFGEAAKLLGLISDADIEQVLARQFEYPYLLPGQAAYPRELVAAYQPFSAEVETLRAVRSQLMLRWFAKGNRALMIASINAGEGVSLGAANLAVVFSQLGERTLLIDANLRHPRQHQIFNLSGRLGLSDILADRAGSEAIARIESFVDLSVLPAGTPPPNPQELLSRTSFGAFNDSLASKYDVVLIDVCAFSTAADALAIAARVGGVLLVVRKGATCIADLNAVSALLGSAGSEVVGSVLFDF
jgi:protein-tyrosine kinase